jgi:hypothetical protein
MPGSPGWIGARTGPHLLQPGPRQPADQGKRQCYGHHSVGAKQVDGLAQVARRAPRVVQRGVGDLDHFCRQRRIEGHGARNFHQIRVRAIRQFDDAYRGRRRRGECCTLAQPPDKLFGHGVPFKVPP